MKISSPCRFEYVERQTVEQVIALGPRLDDAA